MMSGAKALNDLMVSDNNCHKKRESPYKVLNTITIQSFMNGAFSVTFRVT